jgi:hypothetical protein
VLHLAAWITLPDGAQIKVGELACSDPKGDRRFAGEFAYDPAWLRHRHRFPLDPVSLPLNGRRCSRQQPEPPLGVIEDARPDDWGRALIMRRRQLPRAQQGAPFLLQELAEHGAGLGAIMFARGRGNATTTAIPAPVAVAILLVADVNCTDMADESCTVSQAGSSLSGHGAAHVREGATRAVTSLSGAGPEQG